MTPVHGTDTGKQAFDQGWSACASGRSQADNPYSDDPSLAQAWSRGWSGCNDMMILDLKSRAKR